MDIGQDKHRIAIAGFGNVGQAVARLIADGHPSARGFGITAVTDPRFGTVLDGGGIDPTQLLDSVTRGSFELVPGSMQKSGVIEMIDSQLADTLVELTFTDLETGEPAATHIRHAFARGMHVSTTNKGPVALHYQELRRIADRADVAFAFEGTVMSGTPSLEVARTISSAGCDSILGILNGTTNFIITKMEEGTTYASALAEAQDLGYAEANPIGDVEGGDAAAKLAILTQMIGDSPLPIAEIKKVALGTIDGSDIADAASMGERWRYLAKLSKVGGGWQASVSPTRLPESHPLSAVSGATNAITFQTQILGEVTLVGPGAGRQETAFAVMSDLHRIRARIAP